MVPGAKQYLTLRISQKDLAIDAAIVAGIVPACELSPVPANRMLEAGAVAGFASLSGYTFPVLDLCARLGLPEQPMEPQTRIVVIQIDGALSGFLADRVVDIVEYPGRNVRNGRLYGRGRTRRLIPAASLQPGASLAG